MSITVRLWSEDDLQAIDEGKDTHLATVFLNGKTFSGDELGHYPYTLRKTYLAELDDESVEFYATDDDAALWFLAKEYTRPPDHLFQLTTQTREVMVRREVETD